MRLFLAINIPDDVQNAISPLMLSEIDELRWSPLHQLHITLSFLGELPESMIDEIAEAITEIDFQPFKIKLRNSGFFKSGIYWVGVEESIELLNLQRKLHRAMLQLGIKLEKRRYTPHVTIARGKTATPALAKLIETRGIGFEADFIASSFDLISSHSTTNGVDYQSEATFTP